MCKPVWLLVLIFSSVTVYAQFNLAGDAISLGGDCYRLTTTIGNQEGAAWYTTPISLEETFKISFDIYTGTSDGGADGMTFTFQTNNTGVGIGGGSLGVQGISPSVHLEFDTWQNGDKGDPWYDHMGLNSMGEASHSLSTALTPYYYVETGVTNIEDNTYREVIVLWEADIQTYSVWVDCAYRFSYTGDLVNDIFGGDPEVYFGFTGSTGGAVNTHIVCFNYIVYPEDPEPLPDAFICEGDSVQMEAAEGFVTYTWSPATGVSDPGIADPWFSPVTTTTYYLTMSDECGISEYDTVLVEVEEDDSEFSYPADTYCAEGTVLPDYIESPGGFFSIEPPGLLINSTTGQLNLDGATPGTYVVEYVPPAGICPVSSTQTITIEPFPDASFSYPETIYCAAGTALPADVVVGGGSFSASPAGLSVNTSTGLIDLATATIGETYTIYYDVTVFCSSADSFTITIQDFEDAGFAYDETHYCPTGTVLPAFINTAGGTFSVSPAGLVVDPSTGELDLSSGTVGTNYTITYLTSATDCGASSSVTLFIDPLDDASFAYSDDHYCATGTILPDYITTSGGSFTADPPSLLVDAVSGEVDLETGAVGTTYTITYTTADGPCQNWDAVSITIDANDDSTFSYTDDTFCPEGVALPDLIATPGGSFTAWPAGLGVDAFSGLLDLSTATPGTYTVTYTTPVSLCTSSMDLTITIDTVTDAFFAYDNPAYCRVGSIIPFVLHPGGDFTADAGLVIDAETGEVDLESCTPGGPYAVYYQSPGCTEEDTVWLTIWPEPELSFAPDGPLCIEDAPLLLTADPTGGSFAGTGVAGGSFVPGAAGEGLFELTYSYTDVNGCSNEISAFLEVIENSVSVGADVTIIEGTSTALQAVGGVIFSWEPADGLSCTGCASPLASPAQTTTYWVTSWDAYGCMAIDTVRVEVVPFDDVTVFVPNTFTPNFDGINDYLFVYGSDIERINYLRIFDRWGNEVWFGENLPAGMENTGWNGTSNGTPVNSGTYAFIAEVQLTFGVSKRVSGNVTLLR